MRLSAYLGLLISSLFLTAPACAQAQASLPSLAGVDEIQVQPTRIGNRVSSERCGYTTHDVSDKILALLKSDGLPAFSILESQQLKPNHIRVELLPEVVTLLSPSNDCFSWVSLTVLSEAPVTLPPVQTPRNVTIVYWRGGLMISAPPTSHSKLLFDAASKLAAQFSRQYQLDQPPSFAPPKEPEIKR